MDARIVLLVLISVVVHQTISFESLHGFAFGSQVDAITKLPSKRCMGANTKPSTDRLLAEKECSVASSNKRCGRLCLLEKLDVIGNNEINERMWPSFVEASFPTIAHSQLTSLLVACTPMYSKGTNSNTSADCSENVQFTNCMRDAIEVVCSQPLPL